MTSTTAAPPALAKYAPFLLAATVTLLALTFACWAVVLVLSPSRDFTGGSFLMHVFAPAMTAREWYPSAWQGAGLATLPFVLASLVTIVLGAATGVASIGTQSVRLPLSAVLVSGTAALFGLFQLVLFGICSLDIHGALGSLM